MTKKRWVKVEHWREPQLGKMAQPVDWRSDINMRRLVEIVRRRREKNSWRRCRYRSDCLQCELLGHVLQYLDAGHEVIFPRDRISDRANLTVLPQVGADIADCKSRYVPPVGLYAAVPESFY